MVAILVRAFPAVTLNAWNCFGDTALHCAVAFNCGDNVQLLLDLGADTTLRDKRGQTAEQTANGRLLDVFAKHAAWIAGDRCPWI